MGSIINKLFAGRFRVLFGLLKIFLLVSMVTRLVLAIKSSNSVSWNPIDISLSFVIGFLFDLIAFFYYALPLVVVIFITPTIVAKSRWYKAICWFFYGLTIF
ncbi:MAG: hypothetical protein ACKOX3_06530, partial [Bacteroidota bacterium]